MNKSPRYIFISMLLASVLFLAFRAGQQGSSQKPENKAVSQKLFRSFPLFDSSSEKSVTTEMETEDAGPAEPSAEPSAEPKKSQKQIKPPKTIQDAVPLKRKEPVSNDFLPSFSSAFIQTADALGGQTEKNRKQQLRHKTIPHFSEVFIPVYTQENFDVSAFAGFDSSTDLSGMIFVIEKEIPSGDSPSGDSGSSYEILVYAEEGGRFITAIETRRTTHFPFIGVPRFTRVRQQAFTRSTRFFIFSDSFEQSEALLNDEDHAGSILKTAYRSSLEKQTFVGTDPRFGLNIYSLFPGIYLAWQSLE